VNFSVILPGAITVQLPVGATGWSVSVCPETVRALGCVRSIQTAPRGTSLGTCQALGSETTIAAGPGLAQRNSR